MQIAIITCAAILALRWTSLDLPFFSGFRVPVGTLVRPLFTVEDVLRHTRKFLVRVSYEIFSTSVL